MKLIEAKDGLYVFRFTKRDRLLLTHVLKQFPIGGGPVAPMSKSGDPEQWAESERLLAESVAEHVTENVRMRDLFLGEQGRFVEDGKSHFRLRLTSAQLDWMLRVLNEVRVGLWRKLGQPAELAPLALAGQLDEVVTMELCALFQTRLLTALDHGDSSV